MTLGMIKPRANEGIGLPDGDDEAALAALYRKRDAFAPTANAVWTFLLKNSRSTPTWTGWWP